LTRAPTANQPPPPTALDVRNPSQQPVCCHEFLINLRVVVTLREQSRRSGGHNAMDDKDLFIIRSHWAERDDITGPDCGERNWLDDDLIPRPQRAQHATAVIGMDSIGYG
jgi:hypothetical protein